MQRLIAFYASLFLIACTSPENKPVIKEFKSTPVNASIRALKVVDKNEVWFAGSKGVYGFTKDNGATWTIDSIKADTITPHFRSIAVTSKATFLLSIESPALLYKSEDDGRNWNIVYQENHPKAFYDAMAFWDDQEGIAIGDPTDECLSIIITRDGGEQWEKLPCSILPPVEEGEAAFAASNSNIALFGNHAWIVTGGKRARIFHSADRGKSWESFDTPIIEGGQMTGIYTVDFYNEQTGIIFGGDWNEKEMNYKNKAITNDGGQTWTLLANGQQPGYRSCVKFIPKSNGEKIMAVGLPGISFSNDGGYSWSPLSNESYYTVGIAEDSYWVAGHNRLSRIVWSDEED